MNLIYFSFIERLHVSGRSLAMSPRECPIS
jgi:hypothetical protein